MSESLRDQTIAGFRLRRPIRTPFERWPHATDIVIAFVAAAGMLAVWSARGEMDLSRFTGVASWLIAFSVGFSLLWRRSYPSAVHAFVIVLLTVALVAPMADSCGALAFTLYSVGRYEPNLRLSVAGVAVGFLYLAIALRLFSAPTVSDTLSAVMAIVIWYSGRRMRFRGEYLRLLEERAQHLERQQHAEAERAVAAERTRIAREMHDVVAHQVSLMTVQAGAARMITASDPKAAGDAMAAVESAGRQALTEMRGLLGVLRPTDARESLAPQPGIEDLNALVQQVRDVGPSVDFQTTGNLAGLSAQLQLSIYRIVQEALTNVIKHAGEVVNVQVCIDGNDDPIVVRIADDGRGADPSTGGHGIVGMRERAELLGGTLRAGRGDNGFEVLAELPRAREAT